MEGNRNVLKRDVKRQLSRACAGGVPYVVKEFRRPRKWMPCLLRADRGSWVNSRRLAAAEIPLLRCLGWLRAADGRGFLLFEDGGDVTLERTMARRDLPAAERLRLLEAAVELLARLHGAGLVYGDFNPANIMIPAADGALRLVDYDRLHVQYGWVPMRRRVYNLVQFMEPLSAMVSPGETAAIPEAYCRAAGLIGGARTELLRRLRRQIPGLVQTDGETA